MQTYKITTNNAQQTINLGRAIARSIKPGLGILLTGELGAGKTTISSGICAQLGVKERVKSPTFVLTWVYEADVPIYHIDLYRLGSYDELENIGWEEMVDESKIYIVEWADMFDLPYTEKALKMKLEYGEAEDERIIELAFDEKYYPDLKKDLEQYENSRN